MDATRDDDAPTPTIERLVRLCEDASLASNDGERFFNPFERKDLRWLASQLPGLIADAKLLDSLVASPAQITVGRLTLREIRDKFRADAARSTPGGRTDG